MKKLFKKISAIITSIIIISVFSAYGIADNTTTITNAGTSSCVISASMGSNYKVTLPLNISLANHVLEKENAENTTSSKIDMYYDVLPIKIEALLDTTEYIEISTNNKYIMQNRGDTVYRVDLGIVKLGVPADENVITNYKQGEATSVNEAYSQLMQTISGEASTIVINSPVGINNYGSPYIEYLLMGVPQVEKANIYTGEVTFTIALKG